MYQDSCYDRDIDIQNNFYAETMDNNIDMNINNMNYNNQMNYNSNQLVEPMQERQVHRTIMHEINHVCPIRTRIINHHVYKHTYRPEYTCCEENVVSCVNDSPCNKF